MSKTWQEIVLLADWDKVKETQWDDIDALVKHEENVDRYLRGLSPVYECRKELRARIAELRGPAKLPRPRNQSDVQRRVAQCPRCGAHEAVVH